MAYEQPPMGSRDSRHGTPAGYSYWGCRCNRCRKAAVASSSASREKKLAQLLADDIHGYKTYKNGCRCPVCKAAASEYRRANPRITRNRPRGKGDYINLKDELA